MRKIYLFLLLSLHISAAHAQPTTPVRLDSITQALNQQLAGGPATALQRVVLVRQQLEAAVLDQQQRQIPLLLDYLALAVPKSVPTVQPGEAMSLLLAAGAFGPLLKRVVADQTEAAQQRYAGAGLLPPSSLADVADFYSGTHVAALTAQAAGLSAEESGFVRLLLEVLPRGGVSPDMDAAISAFLQQFPVSPYAYLLRNFRQEEQRKITLRILEAKETAARNASWRAVETARISNLRFGVDVHSGTAFFTGALGEAFQSRFNLGAGADLAWKHYVLFLRDYLGWATVRTDFTYLGNHWSSGQRVQYFIPEASFGYRFFDSDDELLTITPFVGVSVAYFSLPVAVTNRETELYLDRPFTAGLSLDLLLGSNENQNKATSLRLKIRGGFRAAPVPMLPDKSSFLFYLNVGLGYRIANIVH